MKFTILKFSGAIFLLLTLFTNVSCQKKDQYLVTLDSDDLIIGVDSINVGDSLKSTIKVDSKYPNRFLPTRIDKITSGKNIISDYNYSKETGEIIIPSEKIIGDIFIVASATKKDIAVGDFAHEYIDNKREYKYNLNLTKDKNYSVLSSTYKNIEDSLDVYIKDPNQHEQLISTSYVCEMSGTHEFIFRYKHEINDNVTTTIFEVHNTIDNMHDRSFNIKQEFNNKIVGFSFKETVEAVPVVISNYIASPKGMRDALPSPTIISIYDSNKFKRINMDYNIQNGLIYYFPKTLDTTKVDSDCIFVSYFKDIPFADNTLTIDNIFYQNDLPKDFTLPRGEQLVILSNKLHKNVDYIVTSDDINIVPSKIVDRNTREIIQKDDKRIFSLLTSSNADIFYKCDEDHDSINIKNVAISINKVDQNSPDINIDSGDSEESVYYQSSEGNSIFSSEVIKDKKYALLIKDDSFAVASGQMDCFIGENKTKVISHDGKISKSINIDSYSILGINNIGDNSINPITINENSTISVKNMIINYNQITNDSSINISLAETNKLQLGNDLHPRRNKTFLNFVIKGYSYSCSLLMDTLDDNIKIYCNNVAIHQNFYKIENDIANPKIVNISIDALAINGDITIKKGDL